MNIINKFTTRTLKQNKTRTIVTIIGIIISFAMFTAVSTIVSSVKKFAVNIYTESYGDWHGGILSAEGEDLKEFINSNKNLKDVDKFFYNKNIGYAKLEDSGNFYMPYLFIMAANDEFINNMPVKLLEGRMPENSNEIIMPKHIYNTGNINYKIGDTLKYQVGDRIFENEKLGQVNPLIVDEDAKQIIEEFSLGLEMEYKLVGIYERPTFENFSSPGYTAISLLDEDEVNINDSYDLYIKLKKSNDIYDFIKEKFSTYGDDNGIANRELLRLLGSSINESINQMLYFVALILYIIISFGSISLIYNAFGISITERTKQYGLLSSIGATRAQILNSVLYEALVLSIIGIPIGVMSGLIGIGITLKVTENMFLALAATDVKLSLCISGPAIVIAIFAGLITVIISAIIPAKRASRSSAIEAVRQSKDISINPKRIKKSRLSYFLFGFEGMLASKNYQRSKRKYRATILSLFMSTVLFISASAFSAYLLKTLDYVSEASEYEIVYDFHEDGKHSIEEIYNLLNKAEGVEDGFYSYIMYYSGLIDSKDINKELLEYINDRYYDDNGSKKEEEEYSIQLNFIDNKNFEKYLKENNLNIKKYTNKEKPLAIAYDFVKLYSESQGKYKLYKGLNKKTTNIKILKSEDDYINTGVAKYIYLEIVNNMDKAVFNMDYNYGKGIQLLLSEDLLETVLGKDAMLEANYKRMSLSFKSNKHRETYDSMFKILQENNLETSNLYNMQQSQETERTLVNLIRIFSYGFIVLISLIAAANVFNTISTNIILRRREFAMLKSVGLAQVGFKKMMNYECFLYGIKGLLYGIPVSIGITYLIYLSFAKAIDVGFFIPWLDVVIAVASVFIVVFATMIYSTKKINKENLIDTLKNENI